ncbi:DUF4870 domain-containing protein [Lutimonas halocynthiae]|jgi:uncharacterized Tic20 family protein|uniref:DUF4870 domain-containing protein n=1 Tax=Lutimonas halocynthiae TaxID=1446477 RepID=UPI0025B42FDD|nr:DUF4870 domain-containing protein [Lutimonas halocynthiae]MDN3642238.1 DUF4870 domain-containing protein [Lutimonas halocynthiae]
MREDRQTLMLTHLSQLLDLITGFGGFIVPLVIWITKKDEIYDMDEQGKGIINFQLSMFLYALICVPLILLIGLGFLGLIAIGILCLVFPVINAIKVNNGETPHYPLSIKFIA